MEMETRSGAMRFLLVLPIAGMLAACGVGGPEQTAPPGTQPVRIPGAAPPPGQTPSRPAQPGACDVKAGDSAYAVCWATRPDGAGDPPRRVVEIVRRSDTLCIITLPGVQRGTDGTRRTKVLYTAVVENIESDSIGCR